LSKTWFVPSSRKEQRVAFRYLSNDTLAAVRTAAIHLGFNTDGNLAALAAGISPAYVGGALVGPNGNAKLLNFTEAMNQTRSLVTDEVPLEKWLNNAILLAAGNQQELVFRKALESMAADSLRRGGSPGCRRLAADRRRLARDPDRRGRHARGRLPASRRDRSTLGGEAAGPPALRRRSGLPSGWRA
jgi:hypothetical protein